MSSLLLRWLTGREKVGLATTPAEREALYRLRYEVYGLEKGWQYGGVDHTNRRVFDPLDEAPSARHLYVGELPGELKGTLRAQVFEGKDAPEDMARAFAFRNIRDIERYRVAEFGRFAIRKEHRGGAAMPALVRGSLEQIIAVDGVDLLFCNCRPHLLRYYRRMGFKPYNAPNIRTTEGLSVPLIAVPSDPKFLEEAGSVFAADAKKFLRRSGRRPINARDLGDLFESDTLRIQDEAKAVFAELEQGLDEATRQAVPWPTHLSGTLLDACVRLGYILDIAPGEDLTREGRGESEIFVVLRGKVEVRVQDRPIAVKGEGEILGEMAWFLESGKRTSTLVALTPCRVLVLDRKFPEELAARDPHAALELHRVIGRTLAQRLDAVSRTLAERDAELGALRQRIRPAE